MYRNGYLSKNDLDSLKDLPIIKFTPDSHREGLATYFRAYIQNFMQKWVKENQNKMVNNMIFIGTDLNLHNN